MRCRHRSTASIVFSSAKYASRDIRETMRSQFSTMSPSRSRRLLEGKDLILFGFGGDAGTQAILAGEVYWPADPFLERLLDAAVAEDAPHHGRIHLDDDVDICQSAPKFLIPDRRPKIARRITPVDGGNARWCRC